MMTDEVNRHLKRIFKDQDTTLHAARTRGPTEVYIRHTTKQQADFDATQVLGFQQFHFDEIAVRVIRNHHLGLAGGSLLISSDTNRSDLIERAEAIAVVGQVFEKCFAPPTSSDDQEPPQFISTAEIAHYGSQLINLLLQQRSMVHWSGSISVTSRVIRIVHTEGLDASSMTTMFELRLRGRSQGNRTLIDRFSRLRAASWSGLINEAIIRINLEFPHDETMIELPHNIPLAIGPAPLAQICHWLIANHGIATTFDYPPDLSIRDTCDTRTGSDDEGVPLKIVPMLISGVFHPWSTLATHRHSLNAIGRGLRRSIATPPQPTALGLEWRTPTSISSYLMLSEFAAFTIGAEGVVRGTSPETIFVDRGQAVRRTPGKTLSLSLKEIFGSRFAGTSVQNFAVDAHRLPALILQ